MATEAQVAANRINGLKGGVKTAEGKAISRLNARKHGIFASALTSEDARELRGIEEQLAAELSPAGLVEGILVEKLAVTYLRMQRCARVESEHYKTWRLDTMPGRRAACEKKLEVFGMHDVRLTNQFLRLLREIKELQRERLSQRGNPQMAQTCSNARPEEATENVDSRLRGNDDEKVKNEPNPANADCRMPIAECESRMRNEPNSPEISECRLPISECYEN